MVKFMFSKIDESFTVDLTLCSKRPIDGEDFVNFCGLLRKYELYHVCAMPFKPVSRDHVVWHTSKPGRVRSDSGFGMGNIKPIWIGKGKFSVSKTVGAKLPGSQNWGCLHPWLRGRLIRRAISSFCIHWAFSLKGEDWRAIQRLMRPFSILIHLPL